MHHRYRNLLAAASIAVVTATAVAYTAGTGPAPSSIYAPTGPNSDGTVLPNGRLVTPAGAVHDVGDFPLGVAVSPNGRLVAAINSGMGMGINTGFNSYCGQSQNNGKPPPCPYLAHDSRTRAQLGSASEPTYDESISVLDTQTGDVSDVKAVRTTARFDPSSSSAVSGAFNFFYVGITFSPDGRHLYAAGGGNDSIYDFPVSGGHVGPAPLQTVVLPSNFAGPKAGPLSPNYPVFGSVAGFTKGMAVSPDGRYLLVSHEFNNTLDIVDTQTDSFNQVPLVPDPAPIGGFYPYGVAVSPDGSTAYVAGQGLGVVAVVSLSDGNGAVTGFVSVGDHPTALALSPDGSQLYVANADDDTLSIVDTATRTVTATLTLHVLPGEQLGSVPDAVAVSSNAQRLYVALAGDDAVAVLGTKASFEQSGVAGSSSSLAPAAVPPAGEELPNTAAPASPNPQDWVVGGMIPAGWYPSGVALGPDDTKVYVVSAKGLGSRYAPPLSAARGGALQDQFEYDGDNMPGILQAVAAPTPQQLLSGLQVAQQDILLASTADSMRSPHNPIPARIGDPSPITHVIEVVRENRTFDQELGDLGVDEGRTSSQVDAEPAYTEIGRDVTPNAHAVAGDPVPGHGDPAFATADNFYSDGEASVQGHWWTAAANVNDYVEKSWRQYYSLRNHVYDPESTLSQPKNCSIFQSAEARTVSSGGSFTYRNYGELIGLINLSVPGVDLGFGGPKSVPSACSAIPDSAIDPNAVQDESLDVDNRSTAQEFLSDIGLNPDGSSTGQPQNFLRNFSYITLSGDHTGGLSFAETPRSRIAENDAGLGLIVQAISHSSYWQNTAIVVMEDDSQDGLDHEDGHRNLLYVISPWAKHTGPDGKPGYVGHVHYSQASVLKTIELILGLPFLSAYDQNASALYDLFQDKDATSALTAADLAPFAVQPLPSFVPEMSACYTQQTPPAGCPTANAAMTSALAANLTARSRALDMSRIDAASPDLELILWQLSRPDQPVPAQLQREMAAWQLQRSLASSVPVDS
jgi:YVTN family beta-propeller protein